MKSQLTAPSLLGSQGMAQYSPQYNYTPTAAPSYDGSGMQQAIATLQNNKPQTAVEMATNARAAEQSLPTDLQVSGTQFAPEERTRWENFYKSQYLAPQLASQQSALNQSGRGNSTFGAAMLGQAMAQGEYESMKAGEDMYNSRFNQQMQRRQSFFGGEGGLATNAANNSMQNNSKVADMWAQDSQQKNQSAFQAWQGTNANNLAGANFNWQKNTDTWNRDNDLYNRAAAERTYQTAQTSDRATALGSGVGGIAGGVRGLF